MSVLEISKRDGFDVPLDKLGQARVCHSMVHILATLLLDLTKLW